MSTRRRSDTRLPLLSDMDGFQFSSSLVGSLVTLLGSLAWPAVALFFILRYEDKIVVLIDFIKKLKLGPLELEFERKAKEAEALAEEVEQEVPAVEAQPAEPEPEPAAPEPTAPSSSAMLANSQELKRLAAARPSAAILEAWRNVEVILLEYIADKGLYVAEKHANTPTMWINAVSISPSPLPRATRKLLHELHDLRNQVIHSPSLRPTASAALSYVESSEKLVASIYRMLSRSARNRTQLYRRNEPPHPIQ